MDKYYITEEAFERIFFYLKSRSDIYCKNREKTKSFLEGVYFIMRTGCQWIELPRLYGKHKTTHKRFLSWDKKDILSFFAQDSDVESIMIDGSVVRAHACASGYKKNSQEEQAFYTRKGILLNVSLVRSNISDVFSPDLIKWLKLIWVF